jgi:hypothetical protein
MNPPEATGYGDALREWVTHVATHDPQFLRFGAHHHGYRLAPPLGEARTAEIEAELGAPLPAPYRAFVVEVADGGAGPYHGLFRLDHPLQRAIAAAGEFPLHERAGGVGPAELSGRALYRGVLGLGHLGCGYIAFLVVRGPAAGQVWLDARAADDGVFPIHADFRAYYHAWVACLAQNRMPEGHVTPGHCALPSALSAYLARREEALGLAPGTMDGDALRTALGEIGPGGIATTTSGDDPFFEAGAPIDLCPRCAQLVENLTARGLRREAIVDGQAPDVQIVPMT